MEQFFKVLATPELVEMIADRVIEKQKLSQIKTPLPLTSKEVNYTVAEVASMVNKSEATITRHIRNGQLLASKAGGSKSWVISEENYKNYKNNTPNE